jgi:hypothetical protein
VEYPGAGLPALPRGFAERLRQEGPSLATEIFREIRRQIPEYDRPLDSLFSSGLLLGVETALAEFADVIEGRGSPAGKRARIYRGLGRTELAEGRSMDSLHSALRLGGRLAWRRYARLARRVGMRPEQMVDLAEGVFAHVDQIATASVLGYAQAKADLGAAHRRRHRLLELVVSGSADAAELEPAAEAADWALPEVVACAALGPAPHPQYVTHPPYPPYPQHTGASPGPGPGPGPGLVSVPAQRLPEEVLADLSCSSPYLLLPDPELWLRKPEITDFLRERRAVLGPVVPLRAAADSLRWARTAREQLPERILDDAPVLCDRHLPELLLLTDRALVRLLGERTLAPLAGLTVRQRERLESTLLAWLDTNRGSAPQVAARLGIHPQTARSRLHRVHDLFGPALADPETRFEIELALRGRLLRSGFAQGRLTAVL